MPSPTSARSAVAADAGGGDWKASPPFRNDHHDGGRCAGGDVLCYCVRPDGTARAELSSGGATSSSSSVIPADLLAERSILVSSAEDAAVAAGRRRAQAQQDGAEGSSSPQETGEAGGAWNGEDDDGCGEKRQQLPQSEKTEWLVKGTKIHADGTCPLAIFLPFTRQDIVSYDRNAWPVYESGPSTPVANSHLAAATMAMQDFNDRDGSVVPSLAASHPAMANCSVRFPIDNDTAVVDTMYNHVAVSKFFAEYAPAAGALCSMVGVYSGKPADSLIMLSSGNGIPLVGHGALTNQLTGEMFAPLATRTNVNYHAMGEAVVHALLLQGRTDFLATVYNSLPDVENAINGVGNAAKENGFVSIANQRISGKWASPTDEPGTFLHALKRIKKLTYRTIVVSLEDAATHAPHLADAAAALGMLGDDYVWMFVNNPDMNALASSGNANVTKLATGAGTVWQLDGFAYDGEDDKFLRRWKSRGADTAEVVRRLNPIEAGEPGYFRAADDYFRTAEPQRGSAFMYDAVVATGLGACKAEADAAKAAMESGGEASGTGAGDGANTGSSQTGETKVEGGKEDIFERGDNGRRLLEESTERKDADQTLRNSPATSKPPIEAGTGSSGQRRKAQKAPKSQAAGFERNPHLMGILSSEFEGATGPIRYESGRNFKNRDRDSITYGLYNFRPKADSNDKLEYALTNILKGGSITGNWTETDDGPFIFSDGSPTPPLLLRSVPEQNYLSNGVHITGLLLMSIALALVAFSMAFVVVKRKHAVLRAAQPLFLALLVFGATVMTLSVLTLSFDESYGWTEAMLDAACQAQPWLITLGYIIIYCALFSKLWRINQVLQFRKGAQVKMAQVLAPFGAFIFTAVAILAVWTGVDPYVWERDEIDADTGETFGRCQSQNFLAFALPLLLIMIAATVLAAAMAFKTKDIDAKFSESTFIFYTIFLQLQVLIVGVPVIVILKDASADGSYLGRVLVIWTIPMSTILLLIGPKAKEVFFPEKNKAKRRGATNGVAVSGLNHQVGGSSILKGSENSRNFFASSVVSRNQSCTQSIGTSSRITGNSTPDRSKDIGSSSRITGNSTPAASSDWSKNEAPKSLSTGSGKVREFAVEEEKTEVHPDNA